MCGIAGIFAFHDESSESLATDLRPMVARIARRGPDDEGTWTDHTRCALGFRRLSILDLSPLGHQPMTTPDERYVLVFNGEIYNYRELRAELIARGHTPRSSGDAETLLLALAEWGPSVLARVNGMYALAFYDRRERQLLLARDHAGIKPLHFALTERGLVFGSQYDQLLGHRWMAGAFDREAVGMYLRFGFIPAPYGLHAGASQVMPGEWLRVSATGTIQRGRSFDLAPWQRPTLTGDAALDAFDAAFARATKRHLIADVPVGVLLSGGIDSPLVAAETRRQHGGTLQGFTIAVDDPAHDESTDAETYARELGISHVVERVTMNDALALVDDVIAASTEPTADFSMFPTLLVSRLARRHVKVVLSGDGGDELFWGYPSRFASAIGQAPYFGWPKAARMLAIAARRGLNAGQATRDVLEYSTLGRLYQRKHTITSEHDLGSIFPSLPALPPQFTAFEFDGIDRDHAAQWVRWNEFRIHLARVLAKVDRASMYHSLEVRVPLLDREVIDVAWQTDWRTCLDLDQRVGKRVLRRALARRVTHQTPGKRGFSIPMQSWLAGPLRDLVHEHLLPRTDLFGVPVDRAALARVVGEVEQGQGSKAWGVWMLLSAALWSRTYLEVR